jgi:hypothetical protein
MITLQKAKTISETSWTASHFTFVPPDFIFLLLLCQQQLHAQTNGSADLFARICALFCSLSLSLSLSLASVQHSESRKIMSRKIMRADQCRLAIGDSQAKPIWKINVQISFD